MKKIMGKIAAAILAAAMTAAFVGCSDGDVDNNVFDPSTNKKPAPSTERVYEKGNSTVTSIKLEKNTYAETAQTQIKIPTNFTSLIVGDKVKVVIKGTADRELGSFETMLVDTTATANYWKDLSEKKEGTLGTSVDFTYEFTVATAPVGTGSDSMVLAINGLAGDTTTNITVTEFSLEKNVDKKPADSNPQPQPTALTKTSIISGIQSGNDVWCSGTNITSADGVYTCVSGTGWDPSGSVSIPVCFGAGDLSTFTHIVFEADLSEMTLRDDSADYPQIELKVANGDDSKAKVINATSSYNATTKTAEVDITSVEFLAEATKVMFTLRGTGTAKVTDISKAK